MIKRFYFLLFLIVLIGFTVRVFDINWDQGYHLHPDERAITLFATPISFPHSFSEFLSPQSPLNTHFFAYGNFPIYFLKIIGTIGGLISLNFATYDSINILGRFFSAVFDTGTIVILFFLGKKLCNKYVGVLASFFYAISVLPIQTSHFYAVDTILTFFILLTLYFLVSFYTHPTKKNGIAIGLSFGMALATKNSALALLAPILTALTIDFLLVFLKSPHKFSIWKQHIPAVAKLLFIDGIIIAVITGGVFLFWEPYFLIDAKSFWEQTNQQFQMTHDAFTFPYTLQYVGKIPYWYEIKNIFLWGQGPMIAVVSFIGALNFTYLAISKKRHNKWASELILIVFFWAYFLVVGKFAIGFMRYMLPIYPLLALFAGLVLWESMQALVLYIKSKYILIPLFTIVFIMFILWPASFMHIYTSPNTRVLASNWINNVIPQQTSTIAVEHWDDSLPLYNFEKYNPITLTLYDPDTPEKWKTINEELARTDYIIIASNRLYTPLQKMTDCNSLPPGRCYPQTAEYYRKLFSGELHFQKVAEFSIYPTIPFTNIAIDDQSADESFTVYDHPKIMIFKKNTY